MLRLICKGCSGVRCSGWPCGALPSCCPGSPLLPQIPLHVGPRSAAQPKGLRGVRPREAALDLPPSLMAGTHKAAPKATSELHPGPNHCPQGPSAPMWSQCCRFDSTSSHGAPLHLFCAAERARALGPPATPNRTEGLTFLTTCLSTASWSARASPL